MKEELNGAVREVRIVRYAHRKTHTLGLLYVDDVFSMYTLELPDKDNRVDISCIPEGEYVAVPYLSSKHGECYKILDVKGRTEIRIHVGNWTGDTTGCILVGSGQENDMVMHSVHAMNKLNDLIGDDTEFKLIIKDL